MSKREAGYAKERAQREAVALAKIREAELERARLAEAAEIPPGHVRIITRTQHYKRTINGAWWYGGSTVDGCIRPESALLDFHPGYSSHEITWPDGHQEIVGFDNSLYPHAYGPRMQVLNRYAVTMLPYYKRGVMRAVGNAALVDEWCETQHRVDGYTSQRYAQDFSWTRPTRLDRAILDHFNEQHPNL